MYLTVRELILLVRAEFEKREQSFSRATALRKLSQLESVLGADIGMLVEIPVEESPKNEESSQPKSSGKGSEKPKEEEAESEDVEDAPEEEDEDEEKTTNKRSRRK